MTLRDLMTALRDTYTGSIGAEFMHIADPEQKRWMQQRMESSRGRPSFTVDQKSESLIGSLPLKV